ncbi:MAG: Ig-like domain-containing protein [Holophagales bacterium]|nr:Ig-like domain-containing protein [Holophagales bacterium]
MLSIFGSSLNAQEHASRRSVSNQANQASKEDKKNTYGTKSGDEALPEDENEDENTEDTEAEKDDPFGRREWFREWFGPTSNEYLDYKTKVGEQEIEKWGHIIPGTHKYYKRFSPASARAPMPNRWFSIGPFDGSSLQNSTRDPNVTDTGRPTVILPHPYNADILYVGFAGGGLWRCQNADLATNDPWVWAPMTDGLPSGGNTALGAAAFKHDDPNTIYISLGDMMPASAPHGTAEGRGFYISTNGGETWERGGGLGDCNMTKTIVSLPGNVVLVAGNFGLFRSTDGGITFTRVQSGPLQDGTGVSYSGAAYPPNAYATAWDILKLNNGRLVLTYQFCDQGYGVFGGGGIAWSEDNGATWTKAAVGNGTVAAPARGFGRIAIAASGDTLYGLYQIGDVPDNYGDFPTILLKSTDGGKNWVTNNAASLFQGNYGGDGGQAGYNHMIAVDPENPDVVFVGTNLAVYRSINGGANFSQFTSWLGRTYQYTHADMHVGAWTPPGRPKALYMATDGGLSIFRQPNINPIPTGSSNLFMSNPEIIDHRRNRGLATHLIYNLGSTNADTPAGSRDRVIIGTQDNGTLLRKNTETNFYDYVIGGDGFGCLIHPLNGNLMLGSVYNCSIRRSTNGGASFVTSTSGISGAGGSGAPFYTRLIPELADPTGNRVYTFTNTVPYVSNNFGQSWTALTTTTASGWPGGAIRTMGASPLAQNLVGVTFEATVDAVQNLRGRVAISDNGGQTWRVHNGFPNCGGSMGDVAFDTQDPNIMYVASVRPGAWNLAGVTNGHLFNHLWKSLDGGYTWTAIDGTLENPNGIPFGVPIHTVKVDPLNNQIVYAGTEYGLYYTANQGGVWERFGQDLPLVPVRDIYIAPDGSYMRVGTHGRGVWEIQGPSATYPPQFIVQPQNVKIYEGNATFSAEAEGAPSPAYRWQVSANGSTWSDIANATDKTYTGTFTVADSGKRFRAIATNSSGSAVSDAATLTVSPAISVAVSPATTTLRTGASQTFTAAVTGGHGNKDVAWTASVVIAPNGSQCIYTAPGEPGTYTIMATSVEDTLKSYTAIITVVDAISVSVSPKTATMIVGSTRSFTATVAGGVENLGVTWTAGGGTLTSNGNQCLYTAPSAPGTYTITAASNEDPSKSDTATVTVISGTANPVTGVTLSKTTATMAVGAREQLTETVMPPDATNKTVLWSSNSNIATVANGLVTAHALGAAAITVTTEDGGYQAICSVTVIVPATGVTLNKNAATLVAGGSEQLIATVLPTNASIKTVTWSSSNGAIATVSNGLVTAVAPGQATITVRTEDGGHQATCLVTVAPVISVAISPQTAIVASGRTQEFNATVTGGLGNTSVTWSATGGTITATGLYTAPSTPGAYTITARSAEDSTKSATAAVTVVPAVSIVIAPSSANMYTDASLNFTATVTGGLGNRNVTWTITGGGSITPNGNQCLFAAPSTPGYYTLMATSVEDTSVSATASIAVTIPPPVSVAVSPGESMSAGSARVFKATVTGGRGDGGVTWSTGGSANITPWSLNECLYIAPAAPGTYTLTAQSIEDDAKSASVAITVVTSNIKITSPPTALHVNERVTFRADISGANNPDILWVASRGNIDQQGNYTAPGEPQIVTIAAMSANDFSIRAEAQVLIIRNTSNIDGNAPEAPQLLGLANAFGSTRPADLYLYDLNNDGSINDIDIWLLFNRMGW